jgi:hypothetical protein
MKLTTTLFLGLLLCLPAAAFAARPIENLVDIPVPAKTD